MPPTITAAVRRLPNPATDQTLLARFAADRDEPAFAELVRRHGPLVLGVCRRLAGADAEDAFQAVFLVLARKASSVSRPERLANYLYGVAVRVGRRARRSAGRRRERTMPRLPDVPAPAPPDAEVAELIDAALCRLPDRLRAAVVLCEIQGLSRAEAAIRLGIAEGTLSSRLADARKRLAEMLRGRVVLAGLTVPVSAALTNRAVAIATGELVSGAVLALATGGTTMRTVTLAITTLTLAGLTAAAGALPPDRPADPPAKAAAKEPAKESATFTTKPKLGKFIDIPAGAGERIEWSADGTRLMVAKPVTSVISDTNALNGQRRASNEVVIEIDAEKATVLSETVLKPQEQFLAVSPTGAHMMVVRRDAAKISGVHRVELRRTSPRPTSPNLEATGTPGRLQQPSPPERVIDLDSDEAVVGRYSGNGSKILLVRSRPVNGQYTDVRLWEYEIAHADPVGKQVLHLNGQYLHLGLSPYLPELLTVDTGANWEWHSADPKRPGVKLNLSQEVQSAFQNPAGVSFSSAISPDGKRAVVSDRSSVIPARSFIFHRTETGLKFNMFDSAEAGPLGTFSADGTLFCAVAQAPVGERRGTDPGMLTVWRMDDGKLPVVKRWGGPAVTAFSPTKPVLAIAEPLDRTHTRIGFWDFGPK